MNIELIVVGKTDSKEINALVDNYTKRINFYNRFNITYIPDIKNTKSLSESQQKTSEGEAIIRLLEPTDRVVLLDEHGSEFRSIEYADWLQKRMNSGVKRQHLLPLTQINNKGQYFGTALRCFFLYRALYLPHFDNKIILS